MTSADYLVTERQNEWWAMLDGFRPGLYANRQIAIDSAVTAAKIDFKAGRPARVSVQNGTDMVTASDSSSD